MLFLAYGAISTSLLVLAALTILCIGYLISPPLELSGLLLLMTGRERETAIGPGVTAGLNVVLNALLIPNFGLEGAAIATATSIILRGAIVTVRTYQTLKIIPNPLGFSLSR